MHLHQLDQHSPESTRVDECDPMPTAPDPRRVVDQFGSLGAEVLERRIDVCHLDGEVVQAFTTLVEEPSHRGVGLQRGENLQKGATEGDHGLLDTLRLDRLTAQRLDPKELGQRSQRRLEVPDRNGGVVQVDGEHRGESSHHTYRTPQGPPRDQNPQMFEDLIAANARYRAEFHDPGLAGTAARGLAVLTCIDSRIAPLAILGLVPGDAKIIRNAGARVTTDALRSLVLAVNLLGVDRICVVPHTDCAVVGTTDAELRDLIIKTSGGDAAGWEFFATPDQMATLRRDIAVIEACPLIPTHVVVGGFVFDVHHGTLTPMTAA